jgi:tetratricopeptide (TPR) repeat protein
MKLRRQWFRPGRRLAALRRMATRSWFRRPVALEAGPSVVETAPRPRSPRLPALAESIGAVFSILIGLVLIGALLALLYAFVREVRRDTLDIEAISAPARLTERGYTEAVIAGAVLQEIQDIQGSASTQRVRRQLVADSAVPDIQVASGGLSMKGIVRYARRLFGVSDNHIDGEILQGEGMQLRMVLHVHEGSTAQMLAVERADGDIDKLLQDAGRAVVQVADPYVLASYLYDKEFAGKQYTETLAAINYVLTHPPANDDPWAYNLLGLVRADQGREADALDAFRHAIALDPAFPVVRGNYLEALLATGQDAEAGRYLQSVTAQARTADDWGQLILLDYYDGDYRAGLEARKHALALDPHQQFALYFGPVLLYYLHRNAEALAMADQARALLPADVEIAETHAAALAMAGRGEEGLAAVQQLLASVPDDAMGRHGDLYWLRAFILVILHRPEEALADLKRAEAAGNRTPVLHETWGDALLALGRPAEAQAQYELALQLAPRSWYARGARARAMLAQGHLDDALQQFAVAVSGDKDDPALYNAWADALDKAGRGAEAAAKRQAAAQATERLKVPLPVT